MPGRETGMCLRHVICLPSVLPCWLLLFLFPGGPFPTLPFLSPSRLVLEGNKEGGRTGGGGGGRSRGQATVPHLLQHHSSQANSSVPARGTKKQQQRTRKEERCVLNSFFHPQPSPGQARSVPPNLSRARRSRMHAAAMRMRVLPTSWSSSASTSSATTTLKADLHQGSSSSSSSTNNNSSSSNNRSTAAEVYLNIYDISPLNHYLYWFGLGIFHSGIEVHGMEYGFGAHEYPTSGVFEVEPKSCPGFIFRRSVCVGTTDMSRSEVRSSIEDLAEDYHGDTYHLIIKNCNHFTADVCKRLTGKPVPGWVNRLARLGSFFNCVLPESIKVSAVRDVTAHPDFSDDGLGSNASIIDGSDEDDLDHLLTTPSSDVVSSRDKTLTPARD